MIDHRVDNIREKLADLTLSLVQIPSVTGSEAALCSHIADYVKARAPRARLERRGDALIITSPRREGLPCIGLFGHLDTVPPVPDQRTERDPAHVFGRGASDMKAGLALMLEMLEHAETFDRANLALVFYDREEGPAVENGLRKLLIPGILPPLDAAVCLEPTDNHLEAGCNGSVHIEVIVRGRQAHSARPWQGQNAVYRALPVLQRIAAFSPRAVRSGELTFMEVMSVTQVWTKSSRNVVPGALHLNVNFRFAPGRSALEAAEELVAVAKGRGEAEEFLEGLDFRTVDLAEAGADCSSYPLFASWREQVSMPLHAKQAWTDVSQLTAYGIPAVNFGPGEVAKAHQAEESVPIDAMAEGFRLLTALFRSAEVAAT